MAMMGWVGTGMEMVVGKHVGQSQKGLVTYREMLEHFQSAT